MIECPHCNKSYYREDYTSSTCLYTPPIFKDGKIISEDHNTYTTKCTCLNCGQIFFIKRYGSDKDNIEVIKNYG